MGKYLDYTGLSYFWSKVKDYIDTHGGGGGISIDDVYPVGSIYMSVNSTNPSTLFPGTSWVRITDTFLLASGTTYAADNGTHTTATGGSADAAVITHTHTVNSSGAVTNGITGGSHKHNSFKYISSKLGSGTVGARIYTVSNSTTGTTMAETSSDTHTHNLPNHTHTMQAPSGAVAGTGKNMPPYLAVYVWKRVNDASVSLDV